MTVGGEKRDYSFIWGRLTGKIIFKQRLKEKTGQLLYPLLSGLPWGRQMEH